MNHVETATGNIRLQTLDTVYIAIGAALIAICSWISIPTTVPFTLQTFAVFFLLSLLGSKRGLMATLVYILLGAVGLPVFAGFRGGVGILLSSTGGYIIGFLFLGLVHFLLTKFLGNGFRAEAIALVLGLGVCYAFGTMWFVNVYTKTAGAVGSLTALSWCVFPFLLPDLLKLFLALTLTRYIRPVIRQ